MLVALVGVGPSLALADAVVGKPEVGVGAWEGVLWILDVGEVSFLNSNTNRRQRHIYIYSFDFLYRHYSSLPIFPK